MGFEKELATALEAVREASEICRKVQKEIAGSSLEKDDRSPVTIADFASQAVVCRILTDAFPNDPIIGEETAADLLSDERRPFLDRVVGLLTPANPGVHAETVCGWIDAGRGDGGDRFWTLDPIDGTKGFLRGEQYAVSLALIVDGQIVVSLLGCPNLSAEDGWDRDTGCLFSAVRGKGATLRRLDGSNETKPVRVSGTGKASAARFCESVESGHSAHGRSSQIAALLGIESTPVRLDSQAKYGVVARGEADAYLRLPTKAGYREKIWDHAGGVLVVEEAGGKVSDVDGKPLEFTHGRELSANRGVIVSNGLIHDALLEAVARTA
ncbi:Inositol-1-monophosphatase [Caulifigura coniformis]|uniref:3'(2'),5'-bisphosphate nucleotidase n=1 Tax=Caulifigura coniformis TaxID=2527983 RepID=A0A517SKV3_9PLAN|nr:3'(2'),5'-bisphosphate nucleotidase [Caulifigura coniformis]QDT56759.1 Inositol-1-monophosphatase [Caulifigura coniformis]